jgi:nitroreductase/dihydropteridine reductase
MSFVKVMQERYTTKVYNPNKKIDAKDINELQEVLLLTPSSINSQPWKFTFVRDQELKEKLSLESFSNSQKVIDCDTVVVFSRIDNLDLFEQQIQEEVSQGAANYYREFIKTKNDEEIKTWVSKQVYLSMGVFLSACASMGIDATPMEGINPNGYDRTLEQDNYATLAIVAIGYRDENDFNQPNKIPKSRIDANKILVSL